MKRENCFEILGSSPWASSEISRLRGGDVLPAGTGIPVIGYVLGIFSSTMKSFLYKSE